jgi:quercetin dioxygenase-like cupin family protein
MMASKFSQATTTIAPKIEHDIKRRLLLAGMAGAAFSFSAKPLLAQIADPKKTIVSADGIIRTTLENYENSGGEEFKLVLITYPPGVGLPLHHHPSAAHNYVIEGIAESQYEGENLQRFKAGESYQDKPLAKHLIFRNADKNAPLKYLISYTVKKGQPFLIIP